jgi:hypothetical protein
VALSPLEQTLLVVQMRSDDTLDTTAKTRAIIIYSPAQHEVQALTSLYFSISLRHAKLIGDMPSFPLTDDRAYCARRNFRAPSLDVFSALRF